MDERLLRAETIVFDIGKVLLSFEPERVPQLAPEENRGALFEVMFGPDHLWSGFDAGLETNEALARTIARRAGVPQAWEWVIYILEHFCETMEPLPLYHTIPVLKAQGKKIYALTNYPEPSFSLTKKAFPNLQLMDGEAVSSREKLTKPDPAFFQVLIRRCGLDPARSLFIDDLAQNVASAERLGFQTWHYSGTDVLAGS